MKPNPFQVYCMYYLGISPEGESRFYHIHAIARHFGTTREQVEQWLSSWGMEAERFPHMDFNVAKAHGQAQDLALSGRTDELHQFCRKSFEDLMSKTGQADRSRWFEDIDYDNIWDDPS